MEASKLQSCEPGPASYLRTVMPLALSFDKPVEGSQMTLLMVHGVVEWCQSHSMCQGLWRAASTCGEC